MSCFMIQIRDDKFQELNSVLKLFYICFVSDFISYLSNPYMFHFHIFMLLCVSYFHTFIISQFNVSECLVFPYFVCVDMLISFV